MRQPLQAPQPCVVCSFFPLQWLRWGARPARGRSRARLLPCACHEPLHARRPPLPALQAVRLQELTSRLEARGLLEDVDLDLDLDELAGTAVCTIRQDHVTVPHQYHLMVLAANAGWLPSALGAGPLL